MDHRSVQIIVTADYIESLTSDNQDVEQIRVQLCPTQGLAQLGAVQYMYNLRSNMATAPPLLV